MADLTNTNETALLITTDHHHPSSNVEDLEEPPSKKCKTLAHEKPRLLEDRIGSILSCCICLDLSTLAMFQCVNGHLMCASCFNHLLADCKLKDEQTTWYVCSID